MEQKGLYDYPRTHDYQWRKIGQNKHHYRYRLTYPSPVQTPFLENNHVCCKYDKQKGSSPVIVVLHGLEGEFYANYVSRFLVKKGFSCLQVPMPYARTRVPRRKLNHKGDAKIDFSDVFITGFRQAVLDTRKAVDWLQEKHTHMGILGISMGVIISCLAAEIDGRFQSAVYLLGGGDPANMLWDSKSLMVRFYKRMLQQTTSLNRLREKWKVIDPINYIRQNVEHVLMINAKYDTTIPPVYSKKLWEALDRPAIRWLKADHWTSGFFMPFMVRQTKDFFQETLQ